MARNQLEVPGMYKTTTQGTSRSTQSARSAKSARRKSGVRGIFSKLKQVFAGSSESEEEHNSLGPTVSRRLSRLSSHREAKEAIEAERLREERKSKCVAIIAAKRDPPAIQRLLVDCEFCNPPPKFGIDLSIPTPSFTSADTARSLGELEKLEESKADLKDETTYNVGLVEWLHTRDWWLTPTADAQSPNFLEPEITPDRFYTIFDKMIYHTRPLKHPLCLSDGIKLIKAGWVCEGTWPDPNDSDIWTSTSAEEEQKAKDKAEQPDAEKVPHDANEEPTKFDRDGNSASDDNRSESHIPDSTEPHVQFDNIPVPARDTLKVTTPLERVTSSADAALRPVRSAQSSVVSITDSD